MFNDLINSFIKNKTRNSFFIKKEYHSYGDLVQKISGIKNHLENKVTKGQTIGILTYDDIDTYASIFAVWFCGCTYVPINFKNPADRNNTIIALADIKIVLTSQSVEKYESCININQIEIIQSTKIKPSDQELIAPSIIENDNLYILFTSGSTGTPKGVPINVKNINAFLKAFGSLGLDINDNDRVLQMFDLTFDVSIACTIIPLIAGACVFTVPPDSVKYTYVYSLLKTTSITVATIVPSLLSYLRPYFERISLPDLKYCILTAEASQQSLLDQWIKCLPNTKIFNLYGPTEVTIWCTGYQWKKDSNKAYNGLISIGKPFKGAIAILVNEKNEVLPAGMMGEMCISSDQVTSGYWKNSEKSTNAFFTLSHHNEELKLYKTGDLCYFDEDGDLMYCGRIDNQVQIQGFRVELSEIEHVARLFTGDINLAAIAFQNELGNMQIHFFVENYKGILKDLSDYLQVKLPFYMIPTKITNIEHFPVNNSNKVDRKELHNILVNMTNNTI